MEGNKGSWEMDGGGTANDGGVWKTKGEEGVKNEGGAWMTMKGYEE